MMGRRRFLLLVVIFLCGAGGIWYFSIPRDHDADLALERALDAIARSDWDAAQMELEQLHRARPHDARVIGYAAEVAQRRGDSEASITWLERIPDSDSGAFCEARVQAARLATAAGRPDKAERLLLTALSKDPELVPARQLLARLYLLLLRITEMREQIAALDQRSTIGLDELLMYSSGVRTNWMTDDHLIWLEKCRTREPDNVAVIAALGYYLTRQNRRPEARQLLEQVSPDDANDWRRRLVLAEDEIDSGRYSSAAGLLDATPAAAELDERIWLARGRLSYESGDWDGARIAWSAAEQLDPYDPAAAYGTARAILRVAGASAAEPRFERADRLQRLSVRQNIDRETERSLPRQYAELGMDFEGLGQMREAEICFREVLKRPLAQADRLELDPERALERIRSQVGANPVRLATCSGPETSQRLYAEAITLRNRRGQTGSQRSAADPPNIGGPVERGGAPTDLRLEDVAGRVGLNFEYEYGHSREHWIMEVTGGGVAVFDFDRDGRPDVFLSQGCRFPVDDKRVSNAGRLFRNNGGTSFADVSSLAGATQTGYGQGCAAGDFDNDGFADLVVCRYGSVLFFHNQGDGTFDEISQASGLVDTGWSSSAAFGDFDRDGDLDLYVVHYVRAPYETLQPCGKEGHYTSCRPLDFAGEDDTVWENSGAGQWINRTVAAGFRTGDGKGLGVVIADFDHDDWPDVFVGNDTTPNFLFQNQGRRGSADLAPFSFSEVGITAGVGFDRNGEAKASMGIACADVDGDGLFDLFVTAFERQGSTLFQNLGSLAFTDETHAYDLADSTLNMMGWGCQFLDIDADRRPDLVVANGQLHDIEQRPQLYWNSGKRRFVDVSKNAGSFFRALRLGRSVALLDWNGDLVPDVLVTHQAGPAALLENRSPGGHRLAIRCAGTVSNRDAEGAIVTVVIGGEKTVHRVTAGGGYYASNESTLFVGVGAATRVDLVEIRWPSGAETTVHDLPADRVYHFVEGRQTPPISLP